MGAGRTHKNDSSMRFPNSVGIDPSRALLSTYLRSPPHRRRTQHRSRTRSLPLREHSPPVDPLTHPESLPRMGSSPQVRRWGGPYAQEDKLGQVA